MSNSNIMVDSNDISLIQSSISSSTTCLSDITSTLSTKFNPLIECDLFTDNLTSIINKIKDIESLFSNINGVIGTQLNNYDNVENEVANYGNDYMSYYSSSGKKHKKSKKTSEEGEIETDDVKNGKSLNVNILDTEIKDIDDSTLIECINFLNVNKSDDTPFNVFLDEDNEEILATYLEEFYNKNGMDNIATEDASKVRKLFIEKILNTSVSIPSSISEDSLIKYKSYLTSIANTNNVDLNTLLTNVKYSDAVNNTLTNLYNNNTNGFKSFIDNKATKLNKSVEELLSNPTLLI